MTVYVPPDIEAAVVALFSAGLSVDVGTRVHTDRGVSFVRVTRAGGGSRNLIQTEPRLLIECWGPDSTTAFDLARHAYGLLWAAADSFLPGGVWVSRVDLEDPVNFPDTSIKTDRYQFLATLTTSLEALDA